MARIATQLLEAIQAHLDANTSPASDELTRWKQWTKKLDARMRLDGSKLNRRKKAKPTRAAYHASKKAK